MSKNCFNRGMLSDFMLKSISSSSSCLSAMLSKTVNLFRSLFLGYILGLEFILVLRRDIKRSSLKSEYLHSI